jgi:hypothetical protein
MVLLFIDLDREHRELLVRTITGILSTKLAEITYRQITQGLPISNVAYYSRVPPYSGNPMDHAHEELCPGMLDRCEGVA